MQAVTISSKYQVVLPKSVREKFNLKPKQKIMFIPFNGVLHVVIVPSVESMRGQFKGLDVAGFREETDEARE